LVLRQGEVVSKAWAHSEAAWALVSVALVAAKVVD
jgi:hypothetical protein